MPPSLVMMQVYSDRENPQLVEKYRGDFVYVRHDPEDMCRFSDVASYSAWVVAQLRLRTDPISKFAATYYTPMSPAAFNSLRNSADCPSAPSRVKIPAVGQDPQVLFDPAVGGRVASGVADTELSAEGLRIFDPATGRTARVSPEEAEKMGMFDEMTDPVLAAIEEEKKRKQRNKYIMYGGVAAALAGLGLLGYKMLAKPKKKRRRKKRR